MDVSRHDIVIVGGGGAGLRAAIEAAEQNPNASIALVSKVYPMRSHTVSAEGGWETKETAINVKVEAMQMGATGIMPANR